MEFREIHLHSIFEEFVFDESFLQMSLCGDAVFLQWLCVGILYLVCCCHVCSVCSVCVCVCVYVAIVYQLWGFYVCGVCIHVTV